MQSFQSLTFTTVAEQTAQQGVKSTIYGPAKVGKTTLIATAPRPVIFSAERGLLALRRAIPHALCAPVNSVEQLRDAHAWLTKSHEARGYDTACLDSVSEITEVVLSTVKAIENARAKPNNYAPYSYINDEIMAAYRAFRDIPQKHVLFIAQEEFDKDPISGVRMYRPSMPGSKLANAIPYVFDEMFRLFIHNNNGVQERWLQTWPDNLTVAGDRSGMLNQYEPPNLSYIYNKIMGMQQ